MSYRFAHKPVWEGIFSIEAPSFYMISLCQADKNLASIPLDRKVLVILGPQNKVRKLDALYTDLQCGEGRNGGR